MYIDSLACSFGGDTIAYLHGIGMGTVVKKVQSGWTLLKLGWLSLPLNEVIVKATLFIVACYDKSKSMSAAVHCILVK